MTGNNNEATYQPMTFDAIKIGLGPGFTAGVDTDLVIETMRGESLARVYQSGTALLGARSRIHGFFHGKADLAVFADAEHLDLDRLVLRYKVADFLYKRRGDL